MAEHPIRQLYKRPREPQALRWTLLIVFLHFALIFVLQAILSLPWIREEVYDVNDSRLFDIMEMLPPGYFMLMAVIVAPLWEEIVFRLWMNLRSWTLPVFTTVASYLLVSVFSQIAAVIIALLVMIFTLVNLPRFKDHINRNFRFWFYGSSVLFGLIHLTNYQLTPGAILFTLPQITAGMAIAFVRIQRGFWTGVFVHALWNGALILFVFYPYFDSSPRYINGDNFQAQWTPGNIWNVNSTSTFSADSLSIKNQLVENVIVHLIRLDNPEVLVENTGITMVRVNARTTGDQVAARRALIREWADLFNLEIDTSTTVEDVYVLKSLPDCERQTGKIYVESSTYSALSNTVVAPAAEIDNQLSDIYNVRVNAEYLRYYSGIKVRALPGSIDSSLADLERKYCIGTEIRREEVTRILIRTPDM